MKPTAPLRNKFSVFATTPCRGSSLSRWAAESDQPGNHNEISPRYVIAGTMTASPNMAQSQCAPSLLGTWRLVSFEARDSKGQLQYPLGQDVSGLLGYDAPATCLRML